MKEYGKLVLLTLLCFICLCGESTYRVDPKMLHAIHMVESNGRFTNVPRSDNGLAIGPFQIHKSYWFDSRIEGKWEDCEDYDYSVRVVNAYMNRYAKQALIDRDFEKIARIHNGGVYGYKKESTKKYWVKVKKYLYDNK